MSKVYYKKCALNDDVNNIVYNLIEKLIKENNLKLPNMMPMKVHFGEEGNETFIKPKYYEGIRRYLKDNNIDTCYIETNVLYKSNRSFEDSHIELAKRHGFDDLDIIIADGDEDNPYNEIEVNLKNFKTCKIGTKFADYDSYMVVSHFKGHILAGMGSAIKQLAMGFAARGGKLDQHSDSIPSINEYGCISCGICINKCPVNALELKPKVVLDKNKCVGCAACTLVCPVNVITNSWSTGNFLEKIAEYAYAASKGKQMIHIIYAFNITKDCDCIGVSMQPIAKDIGVFVSLDPVAVDKAVLDLVNEEKELFTNGYKTLKYAEEIGLGKQDYELIEG